MTRSNKPTASAVKSAGKQETVCCRHCLISHLIQYGTNPVLAECRQKPRPFDERHPFEIDVASTPKHCSMYKHTAKEKEIEHREVVRHYPMACYVRSQSQAV